MKELIEFISTSAEQTMDIGKQSAGFLRKGDVVRLDGELGAGKTTFVKGLAKGLGIKAEVSSPTFIMLNEYPGEIPLFHFDAYRLSNAEQFISLGFDEYLNGEGIVVIEWGRNIEGMFIGIIEYRLVCINISIKDAVSREISIVLPC